MSNVVPRSPHGLDRWDVVEVCCDAVVLTVAQLSCHRSQVVRGKLQTLLEKIHWDTVYSQFRHHRPLWSNVGGKAIMGFVVGGGGAPDAKCAWLPTRPWNPQAPVCASYRRRPPCFYWGISLRASDGMRETAWRACSCTSLGLTTYPRRYG